MKNVILLFVFLLGITNVSPQAFNTYTEELLLSFEKGNGLYELGLKDESIEFFGGPYFFLFNGNGYLLLSDTWNSRFITFNPSLKIINDQIEQTEYITNLKTYFILNKTKIVSHFLHHRFYQFDLNGLFEIDVNFIMSSSQFMDQLISNDIFFHRNHFFHHLENEGILAIPNAGPDFEENNQKIIYNEDVRAMFKANSGYNLGGLTIDEENRLFLNGELQTRDYDTFYDYWSNQQRELELKVPENLNKNRVNLPNLGNMTYLTKDKNGNYYWVSGHRHITVFDKNGWNIERFRYDSDKSNTLPAIHPSGDVYFLGYNSKKASLYRVKNVWDPEGRAQWYKTHEDISPITEQFGTLNDSRVRFRDEPNLQGVHLGYLDKNERIEILDQSQDKIQIGDMNDYWYQIKRENGQTGWAYGYFIDIEE